MDIKDPDVYFCLEAAYLNRTLLYLVIAIATGLLLVLIPLIGLAETSTEDSYAMPQSLSRQLEKLEGFRVDSIEHSALGLEILFLGFAAALSTYFLSRRRIAP
ncbi:hypothetical protein GTO27_01035 [Candidatus Bathyarchaeota archaeon]|nr:hypothetical protein [Candidatus Bathyarchaeota archaeon]